MCLACAVGAAVRGYQWRGIFGWVYRGYEESLDSQAAVAANFGLERGNSIIFGVAGINSCDYSIHDGHTTERDGGWRTLC